MESVVGAAACSARVFRAFFFFATYQDNAWDVEKGGFACTSRSLSSIVPPVAVVSGCVDIT
jgi:hypothetical protein